MPQVQKPLGCNKEPVELQKRSNAIIQNKLKIYICGRTFLKEVSKFNKTCAKGRISLFRYGLLQNRSKK